jgi:hypothetical protein
MFVRYRQTETRLQVSLVETRRVSGRVRHEHVASFGSVEVPPSVEDRIAFWQRLHERVAKLANRMQHRPGLVSPTINHLYQVRIRDAANVPCRAHAAGCV